MSTLLVLAQRLVLAVAQAALSAICSVRVFPGFAVGAFFSDGDVQGRRLLCQVPAIAYRRRRGVFDRIPRSSLRLRPVAGGEGDSGPLDLLTV